MRGQTVTGLPIIHEGHTTLVVPPPTRTLVSSNPLLHCPGVYPLYRDLYGPQRHSPSTRPQAPRVVRTLALKR